MPYFFEANALDEITSEINDLMSKGDMGPWKLIPYLGLWWRDINKDPDFGWNLQLSKSEDSDYYWLDVAQKWDYEPIDWADVGDGKMLEILTKTRDALKANLALINILKVTNKEVNE